MKLDAAMKIMNPAYKNENTGFMVSFEIREGGVLRSDYFPDKHSGEQLIETEEEAWELARKFASSTNKTYVNIYVIDHTFSPVRGYENKKIKSY